MPAIIQGLHRADLLADGRQHQSEQILGAVYHIGMREFLVEDGDVGAADALQREVAMRIQLHPDDAGRSDEGAHAGDDIAFNIIVAVRDHRTVQAEQNAVER